MKPNFSVMVSGLDVEFRDLYQQPDQRIVRFDFGDGVLFKWDEPDQTVVRHTYKKEGMYIVKATAADKTMTEVLVTVGSTPELSWWQRFINWIRSIFGW